MSDHVSTHRPRSESAPGPLERKRLPFLDHPLSKQDREDLLIIAIATGALFVLAAGLYLWSKAL